MSKLALRPFHQKSHRVWMAEIPEAPKELSDLIADAMIDFGPDGHCDGHAQIAAIALQWVKDNFNVAS